MEAPFDLQSFQWRLAETIAWCIPRASVADPRDSLRSPALRPPAYLGEAAPEYTPYSWYERGRSSLEEGRAEVQASIEMLAGQRAELLRLETRYPVTPATNLAQGRLLVFFPWATLFDGAAEVETQGFFDDYNIPAWDTWLWYGSDKEPRLGDASYSAYIVSWIPPQLLKLVGRGIEVNPEACIRWADQTKIPLVMQLRGAGFIK